MARGSPDYGLPDYSFFAVETPVSDVVSERQGFSRLDNRGRVIWCDDFKSGVERWETFGVAGASLPVHVYERYRSLGYYGSAKLAPNVNGGISQLSQQIILPASIKMGIEVGFYASLSGGDFNIRFAHKFSSALSNGIQAKIEGGTGNVIITHGVNTQTILTTTGLLETLGRYVVIKFVGDFGTGKYIRAMIGNEQYDLSSYNLGSGVTGLKGVTQLFFTCQGVSAVNLQPAYIQYVVVSGDEP